MKRSLAAFVAAAASACALAGPAEAFEPRVPETFFGISAPELWALTVQNRDSERNAELDGMKAAGLDWVRVELGWRELEPDPPVGGQHTYRWAASDRMVRALATRGMELMAMPMGTPAWAASDAANAVGCGRRSGVAPTRTVDYGALVRAIAERYGRNGSYWAANPDVPKFPVTRFEIWNEPNWNGFWCPEPDPERYGTLVRSAADGIHAVDPEARVILGGLAALQDSSHVGDTLRGMAADEFLQRALAHEPQLLEALDGIGFHPYDIDPAMNLSMIGWLRRAMTDVGLGDDVKIALTEFGWRSGGLLDGAISELLRASNYERMTSQVARTDCGVMAAAAHTWESDELDLLNLSHWYGIASPLTGLLHPSGVAYRDQVALFEGRGPTPAPRDTIEICRTPDPPDQDDDGVPDQEDDYPTDPDRDTGSGEEPPPPPEAEPEEPRTNVPRADDEFFGVNVVRLPDDFTRLNSEYEAISSARVGTVRQSIDWSWIEPVSPSHEFYAERARWSWLDRLVLKMANAGIALRPSFGGTPDWATVEFDAQYAAFMTRFARRYGRGGRFWAENGNLDESRFAVTDYEVWQYANTDANAQGGVADAARYAATFLAVRQALRAVDPGAGALVSVSELGQAGRAGAYVRAMIAAAPQLTGAIDGVAVMAEYARTVDAVDNVLRDVRYALDETGNAQTPLTLGFGAPTSGSGSISEAARAEFVAAVAARAPRSDCLVESVYVHAWTTSQEDPGNPWLWYGIADPEDASLSPTAIAYRDVAATFRGYGEAAAPVPAVHACGRQAPDTDGDGTADPADPAPLDPTLSAPTATPPPAPTIAGGPGSPTVSRQATFNLSAAGAVSFLCRLDGAPQFEPCGASPTFGTLAHGDHVLQVRAVDALGLVGPESVKTWRVDIVGPPITALTGPGSLTLDNRVRFDFQSNETPVSFACRWDGKPWEWCTSPKIYPSAGDGVHEFRVAAVDPLGNTGPIAMKTLEIRTVPGAVAIVAGPAEGGTTGALPEFRFESAFAAGYECRLDGSVWAPCAGSASHRPPAPLADGPHSLDVRGIGGTGIRGPVATRGFAVDSTGPRLAIRPKRATRRVSVFTFELTDSSGVSDLRCSLDGGAWRTCASPQKYKRLSRGKHELRARATDHHGNVSEAKRRWRIRR